ncbi:rifin [Plasmodium falciparum IGH-CR14]|uniref:Rifin n=1 Tax=Plasmodium falciparum IGH-CR14 TaxID=580059 RepID=A0A0L1IAW5_PLAFA|nr:rifin [Plasmodium falciparum IGH-CR14]
MMLNYTNILLFYLSLNILLLSSEVYNQRNHYITRTPKTNTRTLCECELYAPSNYDNDPQMKEVMENFNRQTSERFHEYDERMKTTRQKCKDKCHKEIEKIILKDKIEKELMDKFATLHTDIQSDAIPTCVCEKSMADKMEKECLKCGYGLGTVAPTVGLIGSVAIGSLKNAALKIAIDEAIAEGAAKGAAAGIEEGIKVVMKGLLKDFRLSTVRIKELESVINGTNYNNGPFIYQAVYTKIRESCLPPVPGVSPGVPSGAASVPFRVATTDQAFCESVWKKAFSGNSGSGGVSLPNALKKYVESIVKQAETTAGMAAEAATEKATATLTAQKTGVVQTTYAGYQTPIIASIVAILTFIL